MAYYDKNEALAQAVLDYIVAEYAARSISLPTRRGLGYAGMTLDCEQLVVYAARMYAVNQQAGPEAEGQQVQRCTFWAGTELDVILQRCAPQIAVSGNTARPIPVATVATFGRVMMRDPHIIQRGVLLGHKAGAYGVGANLTFLDTAPLADESGGLVGLRLRVRIGNP